MKTIAIPVEDFQQMKQELETLRDSKIYKRLLEFEDNICKGKNIVERI
ncbi:hypothetical protein HYY69_08200 [Candidatus Woesearchaeota archaeon]|nr:hypothetical protein [Candidatus Woesearchaeota archaeon]